MRTLLLLLFILTNIYAAYPKTFSSMGTPLYKTLPAMNHIANSRSFNKENPRFLSFINKTYKTKKLGYWCDKNRKDPAVKEKTALYVKTLRALIKEELALEKIIIQKMNTVIDKNMSVTYAYLKRSKHEVFKTDRKLQAKMKKYDKKIKKYNKNKKKSQRTAAKKKKSQNQKALRSSKNLNGLWMARGKKEEYKLKFKNTSFTMTSEDKTYRFEATGSYTIKGNALALTTTAVTQSKLGKNPHSRSTKLTQKYNVKKISKKQLWIQKPHSELLKFNKK